MPTPTHKRTADGHRFPIQYTPYGNKRCLDCGLPVILAAGRPCDPELPLFPLTSYPDARVAHAEDER